MWSSSCRNNSFDNDNNNRVCLSPSKSSFTCSSPSPFSPSPPNTYANRKSMEEIWKDINLASLHDHSETTTTTNAASNRTSFPGLILQDFFARPFNKDPPPPPPTATAITTRSKGAAAAALSNNEPSSPLGDITASFGSLVPPKATVLSLNSSSGCDFQFLENGGHIRTNQNQHFHGHVGLGSCSFGSSQNSPFDALGSPSPFHSFCKKRPQENDDNSDDRRHMRMIKNRESAARSRARKQAYTNELEIEVAHLLEENAKLRRQLEKFLASSEKFPKKHSLYRTSTAPF